MWIGFFRELASIDTVLLNYELDFEFGLRDDKASNASIFDDDKRLEFNFSSAVSVSPSELLVSLCSSDFTF